MSERKPGWLKRVMENVERDYASLPEWMKRLAREDYGLKEEAAKKEVEEITRGQVAPIEEWKCPHRWHFLRQVGVPNQVQWQSTGAGEFNVSYSGPRYDVFYCQRCLEYRYVMVTGQM